MVVGQQEHERGAPVIWVRQRLRDRTPCDVVNSIVCRKVGVGHHSERL